LNPTSKDQKAKLLDSRFRGNDEQGKQSESEMTSPSAIEIPACAGTTKHDENRIVQRAL
jgi:hypothetical protein